MVMSMGKTNMLFLFSLHDWLSGVDSRILKMVMIYLLILFLSLFLRRAERQARLLVITLVSDLWDHLILFVCLLPFFIFVNLNSIYWCYFKLDPSKTDQTWSNLIKLDQNGSKWISHQSKNVTIKSCHIYKKDKNAYLILDFFGSDLSKMVQTWSNLIKLDFSQIKICFSKMFSHLQKG
jgi:hypothetical protein